MPEWTTRWEEARYGFFWATLFWAGVACGGRGLYVRFTQLELTPRAASLMEAATQAPVTRP